MTIGLGLFLVCIIILINLIISIVLIKRTSIPNKVISEIKPAIQNLINEIQKNITLADDVQQELEVYIKKAEYLLSREGKKNKDATAKGYPLENNSKTKTHTKPIAEPTKVIKEKEITDKKELIKLMLEQQESIENIVNVLQVPYDEVILIKKKHNDDLIKKIKRKK